eukprot:CAMPEP_0197178268 /NCGR_PEP_ID=MMETSP1423-20130617/3604_1 /TAXON_ID=476441 /ORGANISM="Pseudo-nitzschia heimii, Strain UNC1101" /LENGTH=439 /DNA_ID=CAMNT_0042627975 /DNA_START=72 /DNA_END=1391 /DNA_ORIENTATION=+
MLAGTSDVRRFLRVLATVCCMFLIPLQLEPLPPLVKESTRTSMFTSAFAPQPILTARSLSRGLRTPSQILDRCRSNDRVFRLAESISPSSNQSNNNRSSSNEANSRSRSRSFSSFLTILWRFSRPHTIIGSALAIPSLHILAAPSYADALTIRSVCSMIYAMVPALLMNLYITGLNQITDVEIDRINKPNLPIAAGDLSVRDATITVIVSLVGSLALGMIGSPVFATEGLNVALGVSALLGTLYSLPPFRLKRFPLLAAFCIVSVRGAVINAGFFAHARAAAYGSALTSTYNGSVLRCLMNDPRCFLSSLYFAVFGLVIALMKDVPDIKGDLLSNIRTVSVRLGAKRVYKMMHRLLTGLFWASGITFLYSAIATASSDSVTVAVRLGRAIVGTAALLAGASVQREAVPVDPENPKEVYGYYMHLWKLFYLSYFVLPFAR